MASVIEEGSYLEATLDSPDTTLIPPRPDLRRMLRPIGPVAVYAASNFPFAFSVLGNDTASALAAGCPVIVKAHPGHPRLSALVADLATTTLSTAGAPRGTFGAVYGFDAGIELVTAPMVKAAGFTGAVHSGRILSDLAASRPEPIPFYGELGSVNPVFVTEDAANERASTIAVDFVESFTRDGGQYCTKPGIVFYPGTSADTFEQALGAALAAKPAQRLLTSSIAAGFTSTESKILTRAGGGETAATLTGGASVGAAVSATVLPLSLADFLASPETYLEECFGPFAVIVRYDDSRDLDAVPPVLPGSLTCTIHAAAGEAAPTYSTALRDRVGRVIHNGWPTGVAIAWAQHHGGPWSSTTSSIHTSVGATSIRRWLTPIAYQDLPEGWLPPALRRENPWGLPRRIDGRLDLGPAKEKKP